MFSGTNHTPKHYSFVKVHLIRGLFPRVATLFQLWVLLLKKHCVTLLNKLASTSAEGNNHWVQMSRYLVTVSRTAHGTPALFQQTD